MKKPNCYECEFRDSVAGSVHSSCKHPTFNKLVEIMAIIASMGRVPTIDVKSDSCAVEGNPHGIKNGWFNHPFNFDPIWLISCNGFKELKN